MKESKDLLSQAIAENKAIRIDPYVLGRLGFRKCVDILESYFIQETGVYILIVKFDMESKRWRYAFTDTTMFNNGANSKSGSVLLVQDLQVELPNIDLYKYMV